MCSPSLMVNYWWLYLFGVVGVAKAWWATIDGYRVLLLFAQTLASQCPCRLCYTLIYQIYSQAICKSFLQTNKLAIGWSQMVHQTFRTHPSFFNYFFMGILSNKNFAWEIIILAWKITVYICKTACMSDLHVSHNQGILKFYEKLYKEYGLVCG